MTDYFALEPEVAGGLGPNTVMDTSNHPPVVSCLEYQFASWLGDDLLESYPCYIGTRRLADALTEGQFEGLSFHALSVSVDPEFEDVTRIDELPTFLWMKVVGSAGRDDVGLSETGRLVVCQTALDVLRAFTLDHCDIDSPKAAEWQPPHL